MPVESLNPSQRAAVEYVSGPLLIVAGAGTGKTTVISEKILYLIREKGVQPEQILALTFTEKAAEEMEARVDRLVDMGYVSMQISTFHAFCQRVLEHHGLDVGIPNRFKLLTQTDAWLLFRKHLYDFNLEYYRPLGNPGRHIAEFLKHFSKCKDELISPEEYVAYAEGLLLDTDGTKNQGLGTVNPGQVKRLIEVANTYHAYNQLLLQHNALDFGDLMYYTVKLLEERPAVLKALRRQYTHILVDEFQDVNWAQYRFIGLLAGENGNLTVVGDDDQSIYAFRGASVSNILRFKEDYPSAKEVILNTNYRSGQDILDKAYQLIQNNNPDRLEVKLKIDKRLQSGNRESRHSGIPLAAGQGAGGVIHRHGHTLEDEVQFVANEIAELKKKSADVTWDDIAILVRANNHVEPFARALEGAGIPYEYLSASGLYRQAVVMDCINFFRIIDNVHESSALYRLLRMPFLSFVEHDMQKILSGAKKKSISYYEALKRAGEFRLSKEGMAICERVIGWVHDGMQSARKEKPTTALYRFLEDSGYLRFLTHEEEAGNREAIRSIHHVRQFFDMLADYETIIPDAHVSAFLEHYEQVIQSGDGGDMYQPTDTPDSVNIMTVHAAKGLEFRYVFIVNLVEDRFPTRDRGDAIDIPLPLVKEQLPEGDHHIEEERRLLYVAMTRAKERLYLTSADDYGGMRKKKLSRFLAEMDFSIDNQKSKIKNLQSKIVLPPSSTVSKKETGPIAFDLPDTFSYSQLRSYQLCPYQYKLAHVLHIPTKGNGSLSFGNSIHITLQKFYERVQEMNRAEQSSLFAATPPASGAVQGVEAPPLDDLLALYDESWIPDWYQDKRSRENYYKKGKDILRIFYASNEGQWTVPVALESGFKIKVGDFVIRGKIDRVDARPDGTLEIIDYKTGQSKETVTGEDKDQLLLYQIVAESLSEYRRLGPVGTLSFYYVNDNLKTSFLGDAEELETLKQKLSKTISRITEGDFTATPSQFICGRCDMRDICEYRAI